MRLLAFAFLLVFGMGLASALAFDRLGTAPGVAAIGVSIGFILLMSRVGAAIAGPPPPPMNLVMDSPHWSVRGATFDAFFPALAGLSPPDSFLALAEGAWDREWREALSKAAVDPGEALVSRLARDFHGSVSFLAISESQMTDLASLVKHHAAPQIAMHIAPLHRTAPGSSGSISTIRSQYHS